MNTQITPLIQRQVIAESDSPSYIELATIAMPVGASFGRPGYSDIKQAIRDTDSTLQNDVVIGRPYSAYDCTGQPFTNGIERIKRFLHNGLDGWELISVYLHHISLDV